MTPRVAHLGEVALRVNDLATMRVFYRLDIADPEGNRVEFVCHDPSVRSDGYSTSSSST